MPASSWDPASQPPSKGYARQPQAEGSHGGLEAHESRVRRGARHGRRGFLGSAEGLALSRALVEQREMPALLDDLEDRASGRPHHSLVWQVPALTAGAPRLTRHA